MGEKRSAYFLTDWLIVGAASRRDDLMVELDMKPERGSKNLRKWRWSLTGDYYFVTTNIAGREPLFKNPAIASMVMNSLKWLEEHGRIAIFAAVLMPDHLHFIFELKEDSLSKLMQSWKSFSAHEINKILNRTGPVWGHQYFERRIRNERELFETGKYILENPVRKGLVEKSGYCQAFIAEGQEIFTKSRGFIKSLLILQTH